MQTESKFTPIIKHLKDEDDFLKFGRDGEILPGQEEDAKKYAAELVELAKKEGKRAIFLLSSNFRRTTQTAEKIKEQINDSNPDLKVIISTNDALGNINDGEINIPPDYKPGDKLPGFTIGKEIFNKEVFNNSNPNFLYKFGDPVWNGVDYKYPELKGYFKQFGENYRDFLVRTLSLILDTSKNIDRLDKNTKVVVVAHGLQYEMFYDLQTIAKDMIDEKVSLKPGDFAQLCWKRYNERISKQKSGADVRYIDIGILNDEKIVETLRTEINYLSSLH